VLRSSRRRLPLRFVEMRQEKKKKEGIEVEL